MSSSREQIDDIKSRIKISQELSRHIKLVLRGNDYWCRCVFHNEKTPSMKINDDLCSYYCFGCGVKGDIFTFYTDYLNYSFNDALKELANKTGIQLRYSKSDDNIFQKSNIFKIYEFASKWFQDNLFLKDNLHSIEYLMKRGLSENTLKRFKIGYSYNKNSSLYDYLKDSSFGDKDLLESNLFRITSSKKLKDFFIKRITFPIENYKSNIVAFGGRCLDSREPKYINSPESDFFQKGKILYNFPLAKKTARNKKNLLICEGYMDVISLSNIGINSVVAPLGTSLTKDQLMIAWRLCKSPTLMFDGDKAGKKASIRSALLALKYLQPEYTLKFLELEDGQDPDSYINTVSKENLKIFFSKFKDLSSFIFDYAKDSFLYGTPDQKIVFDKYFDDITNLIENKKVKFFYKTEFKNRLYNFFKEGNYKLRTGIKEKLDNKISSLAKKEQLSFIATFVNHRDIRPDLIESISNFSFEDPSATKCFLSISHKNKIDLEPEKLIQSFQGGSIDEILKKSLNFEIYQLFPYSSPIYNSQEALKDVKKCLKIIETRLLNSSELDKSLKGFNSSSTSLKWNEVKDLSYDFILELDT